MIWSWLISCELRIVDNILMNLPLVQQMSPYLNPICNAWTIHKYFSLRSTKPWWCLEPWGVFKWYYFILSKVCHMNISLCWSIKILILGSCSRPSWGNIAREMVIGEAFDDLLHSNEKKNLIQSMIVINYILRFISSII